MKFKPGITLFVSLVLLPSMLAAQAVTILSSGGDAKACSFAAKMSATLNASRGDLDSCNRALDEVHLTRRDRAATYVNRGILNAAIARFQDALNDYNSALEIEADLPQAHVGKGNLYYLAERFEEAIAAYSTALELNLPERHLAYYNLGLAHEKLNDPDAAAQDYRSALEFMPDWTLALDKLTRLQETGVSPF